MANHVTQGSLPGFTCHFSCVLFALVCSVSFWTTNARAQSVAALNSSPLNPNLRYFCEAETPRVRKGGAAQTEVRNVSREVRRLTRKIKKKRGKLQEAARAKKASLRSAIRDHRTAKRGIKACINNNIPTPCAALESAGMGAEAAWLPRIINGNGLCTQENTPFVTVTAQPDEGAAVSCLGTIIEKKENSTLVMLPGSCVALFSAGQVSAQFSDMFVFSSSITLHPNFRRIIENEEVIGTEYDLAVLEFPVNTTQASAVLEGELNQKLPLYVQAGLGITEADQTEADYLLRAGFTVLQEDSSFPDYEVVTKRTDTGSLLCLDDWGGPLVALTEDGSWRVIGIFYAFQYTKLDVEFGLCNSAMRSIFTKLEHPLISGFIASLTS